MKKVKVDELTIDGTVYIPKCSVFEKAELKNGMPFVMVRTESAGVHCGYMKSRNESEVVLLESIRIWSWSGAASLSQLAMEGTKNPETCKFAMPIKTSLILLNSIEIIEITEEAKISIQNVKSWKK